MRWKERGRKGEKREKEKAYHSNLGAKVLAVSSCVSVCVPVSVCLCVFVCVFIVVHKSEVTPAFP